MLECVLKGAADRYQIPIRGERMSELEGESVLPVFWFFRHVERDEARRSENGVSLVGGKRCVRWRKGRQGKGMRWRRESGVRGPVEAGRRDRAEVCGEEEEEQRRSDAL